MKTFTNIDSLCVNDNRIVLCEYVVHWGGEQFIHPTARTKGASVNKCTSHMIWTKIITSYPHTLNLQAKKAILNRHGIRRITFLFCKDRLFPKYFTFRAKTSVSLLGYRVRIALVHVDGG